MTAILRMKVVDTLIPRGPSLQAAPTQRDEDSPEVPSSVSRIAPFSPNLVAQNLFAAIAEEEQVEVHA